MKMVGGLIMATCLLAATPASAAAGDAVHGKKINAMCIGCHGIEGYRTAFPRVYSVPKIAGQQAVYIVNALKAYQDGSRNHPSMRGIASSLSEQDMADLAAYYSSSK